ncbi:nicotinate-nucleotide-dimethylbenzimidazole phosphoribosyltransferase [Orenia metallireducens]|uniref:Nicotinate-nucleotide--dimethylbenzimidazole phosphoribosyltransferase n=1 Tax=Orenia metallireducens TaxID=1413210 RepID=A0A285GPL1_9FIRM|nr:nicotinate-nucleotide--dimethylbenzimidazole phosphoribosyltransferase [Orenia metallireducens]PRX29836.1 nicotinate-nucleotide-dimethylbenzimidazole phosphoribosyltransferase [Orenia metallireducens]SNY25233.1 nicotinate-nucleotide-dimethylbenzimidazole phosphoribosyltransferase [Orenia metallireducens]
MKILERTLNEIKELDQAKIREAKQRLDTLTKPQGSLGKLEKIAAKLAGITGDVFAPVDCKAHVVMAGDHGVVEEGVSAFSQEVTVAMIHNFLNQGAAINVLAQQVGAEVIVVDVGVAQEVGVEGLVVKKIKAGTDNFTQKAAMTEAEAIASIEVGIEVVEGLVDRGVNLIGTGEMGIGNTTSSSAIIAACTGLSVDDVVGYGSGIDDKGLARKQEVIKQGLKLNQPDSNNGIDILAKVGGLEIGAMAGMMLAAAAKRVPVIVDGVISGAAALIAQKLEPKVVGYLIPSHKSVEPAHIKTYETLGLEPMLDLDMRLGEGTGAVLAMNLVEAASRIIKEMATFEEIGL